MGVVPDIENNTLPPLNGQIVFRLYFGPTTSGLIGCPEQPIFSVFIVDIPPIPGSDIRDKNAILHPEQHPSGRATTEAQLTIGKDIELNTTWLSPQSSVGRSKRCLLKLLNVVGIYAFVLTLHDGLLDSSPQSRGYVVSIDTGTIQCNVDNVRDNRLLSILHNIFCQVIQVAIFLHPGV